MTDNFKPLPNVQRLSMDEFIHLQQIRIAQALFMSLRPTPAGPPIFNKVKTYTDHVTEQKVAELERLDRVVDYKGGWRNLYTFKKNGSHYGSKVHESEALAEAAQARFREKAAAQFPKILEDLSFIVALPAGGK